MGDYEIRKMRPDEMLIAVEWADREGWNPGLYDKRCFYNADPDGFFVGIVDDEIVTMISAVKYGINYGFIGFYIADPDFRGKGFGIQIWNHAIEYLHGRLIGLDGVVDQISNYEKSGFVLAHRNITFKGLSSQLDFDSSGIVELSIMDFDIIKDFDRQFVPEERDGFLKCWLEQPESYVLGFLEKEELKAYGKIRKCCEGYKVGPLFAEDAVIAEKLLASLQNKIPNGSFYSLDIPELNNDSLKMAARFEMEFSFETARMYKNGIPEINLNKVFGVTTYELG